MLVASSLTVLRVTFMYNKVLTMVVIDSNLMTVICLYFSLCILPPYVKGCTKFRVEVELSGPLIDEMFGKTMA